MTLTVEERIRRAAAQLDDAVASRAREGTTYLAAHRLAGPRRRLPLVAAAAALALVLGAAVVLQSDGARTVAASAGQLVDGEGWQRLPESPAAPRFQHFAVGTGDGVLVWGGYSPDRSRTDGAYYDARLATWTTVPKAPLAGDRGDAVGAWTGTEVVVVNGIDGNVKAAAYGPGANRWRKLPDPPLVNAANMMTKAVFVDGRVVLVAVSEEGEAGLRNQVAVLDVASSTWRIGATPAVVGSGFDAVVVGGEVVVVGRHGMGGAGCGTAVVTAYDPATDRWRTLDGAPLARVIATAVASVGREVFVAGGPCGSSADARQALLLDPAAGTWRQAADAPVPVRGDDRYGEVFTGSAVLTFDLDGTPVFYEPAADRWHVGVASPLGRPLQEAPWTWAAGRLVVFGGGVMDKADGYCCDPLDGGYTYTVRP